MVGGSLHHVRKPPEEPGTVTGSRKGRFSVCPCPTEMGDAYQPEMLTPEHQGSGVKQQPPRCEGVPRRERLGRSLCLAS